jgi:hypothetical protein
MVLIKLHVFPVLLIPVIIVLFVLIYHYLHFKHNAIAPTHLLQVDAVKYKHQDNCVNGMVAIALLLLHQLVIYVVRIIQILTPPRFVHQYKQVLVFGIMDVLLE